MEQGSLVVPRNFAYMYSRIDDHHRVIVGSWSEGQPGIVLDAGFSTADVYYYKVLAGGIVGWVPSGRVFEVPS